MNTPNYGERERESKSKKHLIWVIIALVFLAIIGGLVYFLTRPKETKQNNSLATTKTTANQPNTQFFQNQLTKIKKAKQELNQAILQHENILKERQKEATSLKQTESEIQDIQRLENFLTNLKTKKQKIESILPKLEEQINNLAQEIELKEEIIQQIRKEIKELNQELEIPEEPKKVPTNPQKTNPNPISPKTANNPANPNNKDDKNNSPAQIFQNLRQQSQELTTLLDEIIENYEKKLKDFDAAEKQAKEAGAEDFWQETMGKFIEFLKFHLDMSKRQKENLLEHYASEKNYNEFLKQGSESQQTHVSMFEDTLNHVLDESRIRLKELIRDHYLGNFIKMGNEMLDGLKEAKKNGLEVDQAEVNKLEKQLKEIQEVWENIRDKLEDFENKNIVEKVQLVKEAWKTALELEQKTQGGNHE
ncbi:hypothetical protein [endosymbiont GvMRE of Glomus versiforme]|uniref:hypothetical protein n=1 Tax=endosymbiont GvMRE of Glomus versiforme TaxID=2039283 RepID=UPI000EE7BD2D|nr:hypothetical protein [endosymbiont GvMRE of Glomus versiforme]RHZ36288.1 hypothetical protein GvMRE_Ic1g223 [endosymbiont GvMRE of Glomus versiforme]